MNPESGGVQEYKSKFSSETRAKLKLRSTLR